VAAFAEYDRFDALGLAELVRRGEVGPRELLDAARERLDAVDPSLNAAPVRCDDAAEAMLAALPEDAPFAGVPFLLKDLGALCRGTPMTMGSRLFGDYVCEADDTLVARYRRAGLIVFGRTNAPEFGLSYTTEPLLHGPTRNPWNPARTPGGSSGGAAAAVAAGVVPVAHASDGGGSIRVPAACCGLFGLKPTRGRTPAGPLYGEHWAGMAIAHAISRSVRDSAALLDAVDAPEPGAPYAAPPKERPFRDEVGRDPGRLRIALIEPGPEPPLHAEVAAAMERAARLLADLGHWVEPAPEPVDRAELDAARVVLIRAHLMADLEAAARALRGRAPRPGDVEPMTWHLAYAEGRVDGAAYVDALNAIHRAGRALARAFETCDAMLMPVTAAPPIPIGVLDPATDDPDAYFRAMLDFAPFTALANATGAPAMSAPLHWTADGLPIGVQFVAPFGGEAVLFRLAAQLEAAAPWADRRPPLG